MHLAKDPDGTDVKPYLTVISKPGRPEVLRFIEVEGLSATT